MEKTLITILIVTVGFLNARAQGILFEKTLNWDQIIDKAKTEHKYIFLDCYATWCGPCKQMDQNVYPDDKVGQYMNEHFISVKVQMDRTAKDNDMVKSWYDFADGLEHSYTVNAYPTFLFFDPDGQPVHKVIGGRNANDFIQLAKDAQNPEKQYYRILKNFQPGKLDTAEEKGLMESFANSDNQLAGKMAADYLSRISANEIKSIDNGRLMIRFQDNSQVLDIAVNYIKSNPDSLLELEEQFSGQPKVQAIANTYINHLSEQKLYDPLILNFLSVFTNKPGDRGFNVFYRHTAQVDAIAKNKYFATGIVINVISKTEFDSLFTIAKAMAIEPNWDSLSKVITKKYNGHYAELLMVNAKYAWFSYFVNKKGNDKYWPGYIRSAITKMETFRYDTLAPMTAAINNISWQIFQHGDDNEQLMIAAGWMKKVLSKNPDNINYMDTYACILYKAGRKDEAIALEQKALEISTQRKWKAKINWSQSSINKMKNGEQIWLEKEYLN